MAGYPQGGDSLSITKGIVSRVVMTRYAHSSNKLLGIQIDAAINPGNSVSESCRTHCKLMCRYQMAGMNIDYFTACQEPGPAATFRTASRHAFCVVDLLYMGAARCMSSLLSWSVHTVCRQGGPAFSSLQHGRVAGVAFSKLMMSDNIGCGTGSTPVCLRLRSLAFRTPDSSMNW